MQRLALLMTLTWSVPALAGGYELKDLEALEKQESWQEAVDHLEDVPPSKRNDTWQRIAEKSAVGLLNGIDPSKEGDRGRWGPLAQPRAVQLADALMKRYPTLGKSKAFMAARADAGLKGYKFTYSNSSHNASDDPWRDQLKAFVASDSSTPDLALRAGKLVTSRLVAYVAIPFFKTAINGASGPAACKEGDVKASLVSALSASVWTDDAKSLTDRCFTDVRGDLEAAFKKEKDVDVLDKLKENACPIFAAKRVAIEACKK